MGCVRKAIIVQQSCARQILQLHKAPQDTAWCKNFSPCLKFPPHFCQAKWPAHAQPIGPDGTCVTKLSSINFAQPCSFCTFSLVVLEVGRRGADDLPQPDIAEDDGEEWQEETDGEDQ